jgi:hypothetical protein
MGLTGDRRPLRRPEVAVEGASDQPGGDAYVYALTDEAAYLHPDDDEKPAISAEPMPDLLATRACSFCKRAAAHLFGEQYPRTDNTGAIIDGV